ncbi:hypothetical protein V8J88_23850 [Massilia sp. W12]|uniref:hypothetical protein n=1 Tax=Massilia sp. W12 TaxID=3126507 RepID=UPI0030CCD9B8
MGLTACTCSWGLSISDTKTVLTSAQTPYKGTTVIGHALAKHAGRPATFSNPNISGEQVWGKIKGNMASYNEKGMEHLRDILRAPGAFQPTTNPGAIFLEKRLPDGRGIRLNQDMTFKGFVD